MNGKITFIGIIFIILTISVSLTADTEIRVEVPHLSCAFVSSYYVNVNIIMNNDDFTRSQMVLPLTMYNPDGNIDHLQYYGSVQLSNGFEPGGFWNDLNEVTTFSMDGILPDGFVFTGQGTNGWPAGLGEQVYINLLF